MLEHSALLAFLFLGTIAPLIPLLFHLQNRNFSVCCLCVWLAIGNLIPFINGVVWNTLDNDEVPLGKGYCDISTRLYLILQPCLMGCAAAILRYLSKVVSAKGALASTASSRTRENLIDAAIIFGPGILIIILQLTAFQYARYLITPFVGCITSVQATKPGIILYIWSPLIGCIALFYALAILHHLNRKRRDLKDILQNSQSGLNVSRFSKLFALAGLVALIITPANLYIFVIYAKRSIVPYSGNHQIPTEIFIFYSSVGSKELDLWFLWFMALVSITLAGLLGIGKEPAKAYKQWMKAIGITKVVELYHSKVSGISQNSPDLKEDLELNVYGTKGGTSTTECWTQLDDSALPSPNKIKINTRASCHYS